METIRRHEALTDMEIHEDNQGKKHIFSIRFVNTYLTHTPQGFEPT